MTSENAPPQQEMSGSNLDSKAYKALIENDLLCTKHQVKNFESLDLTLGDWDVTKAMLLQCCCAVTGQCCCQLEYLTVEPGCVQLGSHSDGTDLMFGPGVHVLVKIWRNTKGKPNRVADEESIVNGLKVIVTVQQGFIGLAFEKGEPRLLPPGIHQWCDPDFNFDKMIDLSSKLITMGPYTLVTVEEGYAAITIDNGKQNILAGGKSYMLTAQNWKFVAWLSCKMQTNKFGPLVMTTGDNIQLTIVANVNWLVTDAVTAAGKNVDTTASTDSLKMIRDDVILQVTSSVSSLVGAIQYGSQGTSGIQAAGATSKATDRDVDAYMEPEPEESHGRKALWDPKRLQTAVNDANSITERYGVHIMSINLVSAAPSDSALADVMSRGAVAAVAAEETLKEARAQAQAQVVHAQADKETAQAAADAMLIKAKAEADAQTVAAEAAAESERIRGDGSKQAGKIMGESQVAVDLAKLKIAYGPFSDNKSRALFFGLKGPGDLPNHLLGESLAAQTGLQYADYGRGASSSGAAAPPRQRQGGGAGSWFR